MDLGVGGDADGEAAGGHHVLEQFDRVDVVARLVAAVGGRVAAERQDVLDTELLVVLEQRGDVGRECGRDR